jgi:acyl-CoA synthetase (AMP-forming)/AMP-acid ligase II
VRKGSRVGIYAANCLGWDLVAHACARIGAIIVAFNSWWSDDEAAAAVRLTQPCVLVVDSKRRETLGSAGGDVRLLDAESIVQELAGGTFSATSSDQDPLPADPAPDVALDDPAERVDEDDPWLLIFTSGTSGRPKAAVLSHRNVLAFVQLTAFLGARSQVMAGGASGSGMRQVSRLAVFPLFHISGIGSLLGALAFGHKTVWPEGRFDAGRVINLSRRENISLWGGASTHLVRLLDHPELPSVGTQLLQVGIGGSASTPALIEHTERRLPHLTNTFSSGYGMTECGGLASHAANVLLRASADCVGAPLPTVQVKIVDEQDEEVPEGETGTICIRSPLVMLGYWRNDAANSAAFLPGRWLRTEDFGRVEGGLLYLAARRRDLIIRGGENIYPAEIENVLDQHHAVVESAVVGLDNIEFGQVVHAVVVIEPETSVTEAELCAHVAAQLAYYKVPATFDIRTRPLPRNATGKVMKHVIGSEQEDLTPQCPF